MAVRYTEEQLNTVEKSLLIQMFLNQKEHLQTLTAEVASLEEELTAEFGKNGWKQLPDAISRRYRFVPAKVEVEEHHIGVYASKKDGHMVKAEHPSGLLHGSAVSPTLAAAIINGKYVNAIPLCRLE